MLRWSRQWVIQLIPISILMLVAAALRLWNVMHIPFTHDEYSSMFRADHDSLGAMIQQGVITDTHPPLSQFIYYFLIHNGGKHELWIKWPYLLMGIGSVWLLYRLGARWFNATAGLLAASFFAVLQECVMHSQIARPYALGCFLILCAAHLLTTLLFSERRIGIGHRMVTALMLALCALSHHFCMLAAFLLFLGFVFLRGKTKWKELLMTGVFALVLYAPNLFILKAQLAQGGIGTVVGKPSADFLLQYFQYLLHFSWAMLAMVVLAFAFTVVKRSRTVSWQWSAFALLLFLLSYSAGYFYSTYMVPVMHFRVLYFSLPFLFLFIFSFVREVSLRWKIGIILPILLIGSYSLIFERYHYRIFYTSGYEGVWQDATETTLTNATQTNLLAYTPYMMQYQQAKWGDTLDFINPDSSWTMKNYVKLIGECEDEAFAVGFTMQYYKPPIEVLGMLMKKYGHASLHHNYFNSWFYSFGKGKDRMNTSRIFGPDHCKYEIAEQLHSDDSLEGNTLSFSPADEFGYQCSFLPDSNLIAHRDWVIAHVDLTHGGSLHASLVMEIKVGEERIYYKETALSDFATEGSNRMDAFNALYTVDVLRESLPYEVSAYIWNKGDSLQIHALDFYIIDGNPLMYALQEPVEGEFLKKLPLR
ncbi:MAG: glycosyltransferase family 39 protein [Flavobacteriales bacterium]